MQREVLILQKDLHLSLKPQKEKAMPCRKASGLMCVIIFIGAVTCVQDSECGYAFYFSNNALVYSQCCEHGTNPPVDSNYRWSFNLSQISTQETMTEWWFTAC